MSKIVVKLGLSRRRGYLYFLRTERGGTHETVLRIPLKKGMPQGDLESAEVVARVPLVRDPDFLYFITPEGDIASVRRAVPKAGAGDSQAAAQAQSEGSAMQSVWLYHINPKSPEGYSYGWNVNEPKTMLNTKDRVWPASQMRKQVSVGDLLCVYSKKMKGRPDGVYIAGLITNVDGDAGTFVWRPDQRRSARLVIAPIVTDTIRSFFGRGYGSAMQRLPPKKTKRWMSLVDVGGEVIDGVPIVSLKATSKGKPTNANPFASKENGVLGEKFILKLLKRRYPRSDGYEVIHVAAGEPGADHDIAVSRAGKLVRVVEVKTRVGSPDDPVIISETELRCRKSHSGKHSIFIVYLGTAKTVLSVLEIGTDDAFALSPRQHWLTPLM